MINIDTSAIQRFVQRVTKMAQLKQADIRLTLAEASELSASLAMLLAHKFSEQPSGQTIQSYNIDGGGLKRK